MPVTYGTICGHQIQRDHSDGQGHCWRDDYDVPPNVKEEIEGEMIDGKTDRCDNFRASNGLYYRWGH